MSLTEFYKELQDEQGLCERGGNVKGLNTTFGSVLLSAVDFMEFCHMMYDVNEGGEVIFCPPLIECNDESDDKAEMKMMSERKDSIDNSYKSQCK